MRNTYLFIITALAIIAALVAGVWWSHRASTERPSVFQSSTYGYKFHFPTQYRVNEYNPGLVSLTDPTRATNADLVNITVEQGGTKSQSFEAYAEQAATKYCAADGPTTSIRCLGASRAERYTSKTNLSGTVFYLRYVTSHASSSSQREAGPFWAFEIAPASASAHFGALLVFPTHFADESEENNTGAALARSIVDSLTIKPQ